MRGLVSEFYDMAQEIASGESQLELGIIYTQCLEASNIFYVQIIDKISNWNLMYIAL